MSRLYVQDRREQSYRDTLDFVRTPPWAVRALAYHVGLDSLQGRRILEPACGVGDISTTLGEVPRVTMTARDIASHAPGYPPDGIEDYLAGDLDLALTAGAALEADWVVTNPPFSRAEQFVCRALRQATEGVAILARLMLLEGQSRYRSIFRERPPSSILIFARRLVCLRADGSGYPAQMAFAWYVWHRTRCHDGDRQLYWVPPEAEAICGERISLSGQARWDSAT